VRWPHHFFPGNPGGLSCVRSRCRPFNPVNCFAVNQAQDEEFLNGVSVNSSGGIWVSYLTYSGTGYTPATRGPLPLDHQTIYLKPAGGALGVIGDYNVDPTLWRRDTTAERSALPADPNNNPFPCVVMGDYARIGTNDLLGLDSPYVNSSNCLDEALKAACKDEDLFQIFAFDPTGSPPPRPSLPN
jgi:hypothetical protein